MNNEATSDSFDLAKMPLDTVKIELSDNDKRAIDSLGDWEWLDVMMSAYATQLGVKVNEKALKENGVEHKCSFGMHFEEKELKRRAEHYFEGKDEAKIKQAVEAFITELSPFLDKVQALYRNGEKQNHEKRGVKEVFEGIEVAIAGMMAGDEGEALERICKALTTSTLLCYPSLRINTNLGVKELAFICLWYNKNVEAYTLDNVDILKPILERVFCRREVTLEYEKQSHVFAAVEEYLTILAKNFKDYGEKAKSLKLLQVRGILAKRHDTYLEKLSESQAESIIDAIETAREDLKLEAAYAEL